LEKFLRYLSAFSRKDCCGTYADGKKNQVKEDAVSNSDKGEAALDDLRAKIHEIRTSNRDGEEIDTLLTDEAAKYALARNLPELDKRWAAMHQAELSQANAEYVSLQEAYFEEQRCRKLAVTQLSAVQEMRKLDYANAVTANARAEKAEAELAAWARAALTREEPTKPDLQAIAPDEMED